LAEGGRVLTENHNVSTTLQTFHDLVQRYQPLGGAFDELLDQDGEIRSAYRNFLTELETQGRFEFSRRWTQAKRAVRDNGIAYSGYSGQSVRPRTWTLDAIPAMLESDEWDRVKAAVAQRARMLNLVIRDLYGPQELVRNGTLPAELIFSDPNFFRSCRNQKLADDNYLHLYASDVARAPDGKWWILADRTESPTGLGYALEHRIVMSRMLPKAFRVSRVRRLAPFFAQLQTMLRNLAPQNRDNPRVALLSDGPVNPYHLEDAYLARYLGHILVEDGDLTVRTSQVMLKTLGGLQRVDVVLRHQNSADSDPLEHNAVAGVAGLTRAASANEVAIANPLGSGLLESAAYLAFSTRLCRAVLSEDLLLPNVATWWCGEPESLKYVLANLDRLVIHPAFRRRGKDESLRTKLLQMSPSQLANAIRAEPRAFAAKEKVERSSVPVWGRSLKSERLSIRCYAVLDKSKASYAVMDGGLGRVTKTLQPLELSIRSGEKSKDVWVLSKEPVKFFTLLTDPSTTGEVRRSGADLPSRVADNLFWLGRRLERAEDHARLLYVVANRMAGETSTDEHPEAPFLLRCLASEGLIEAGYAMDDMRQTLPEIAGVLPGFVFSDQPDSLQSGVNQLVRLGSLVRDRLSVQAWRVIQQIDSGFRGRPRRNLNMTDLLEITDELLMHLAALSGIFMESMTRTQVFQFLDLGRRIERSQQMLSIINHAAIHRGTPRPILEAMLELADSLMTYRSRYLANLHPTGVLDLILTDETNPRSLAYQFMKAKNHIDQLPRDQDTPGFTNEQRCIMTLLNAVRMYDVEEMEHGAVASDVSTLPKWDDQVNVLSNLLSHRYLVHASSPLQLSDILGESE